MRAETGQLSATDAADGSLHSLSTPPLACLQRLPGRGLVVKVALVTRDPAEPFEIVPVGI